jgi:hypothetical protein
MDMHILSLSQGRVKTQNKDHTGFFEYTLIFIYTYVGSDHFRD